MTIGVLDKDSAPQTVSTIDDLLAITGALNAAKEIDEDAASATLLALIRGLLTALNSLDGAKVAAGTAGSPSSGVLSVQGITSMTPVQIQGLSGMTPVVSVGAFATVKTSVTRPADTNAYVANDCLSDSTSAPTTGGFTFTSAARASGGSGIITDILITSSNDPATLLQGELWIFDQAVTAVNDNAAFALSDSDALNLVAVVPFGLATTVAGSGTNSFAHLQNLNIGFTCSGSANLRFLVKVKNGYTPASAEVLQFRLKIIQAT